MLAVFRRRRDGALAVVEEEAEETDTEEVVVVAEDMVAEDRPLVEDKSKRMDQRKSTLPAICICDLSLHAPFCYPLH